MKSVAVAAVGCRLMKDDGVGVRVAEAIKAPLARHKVDVIIAETDFEYGFEAVRDYGHVIVIDAVKMGRRPGTVTVLPLEKTADALNISQHDASLIDMVRQEDSMNACLIGIETAEVGFGFELSKPLQREFQRICERVEREIKRILEHCG